MAAQVGLLILGLLLAALAAGVAFTHVLEIPGKRRLPVETAVTLQQNLYLGYRVPAAVIESGATLATAAAVILAWGNGGRFWFALLAVLAFMAAAGIFFTWTDPANRRSGAWEPDAPPDDWLRTLRGWEVSHALRAILFLLGVTLLAFALLEGGQAP